MIINTGCRTDIPAYFSDWFYNRIKEGYVLVRNPYYEGQITKYRLIPEVVDCLSFCTKNPEPMLERLKEIDSFKQFWFVTITPYGMEIEPNVPDKEKVMESFKKLSEKVGLNAIGWRYDPIFISDHYSVEFHINSFEQMAKNMSGYTDNCVISFIDLYAKTKRNFPGVREVTRKERITLGEAFAKIGQAYGITIRTCCEGTDLEEYGVDISGCMTKPIIERATYCRLEVPKKKKSPREACNCLLGNDIGAYNTCGHGCIYCYANYNQETVRKNMRQHNPASPFLIGNSKEGDKIQEAKQESYRNEQIALF
jgi:DNA repair photolyase